MENDFRRWLRLVETLDVLLIEGLPQGGTLYHSTYIMTAAQILYKDEISAKTDHRINGKVSKPGVSLTRSFQFAAEWKPDGAIFAIDGDKLRAQSKLIPIDYYRNRRENEEFVIGAIKPLSRFLTKIIITPETAAFCQEHDDDLIEGHKDFEDLLKHPLLTVKAFPFHVPHINPRK
ncbi:unnamed protein product [Sphagnum tenellum]